MPSFHNGDVEIAYLDEGEGDPILLVHGFASTRNVNWVYPTWVSELRKNGRRVIALDNRGHGDSGKLYDAAAYEVATMAGDVIALMDHLKLERADVMGYSLGSRMTAVLARQQPQRLRSAIFGGIGIGLIEGGGPGENVAAALEAPSLEDVTDPVGRTFRAFADQTRSDRRALAACLRGSRRLMTREEAAGIAVPVLIAVGTADEIAGSAVRSERSSRAPRCSIFQTAITCGRSATRSTRRACWIFSHGGSEVAGFVAAAKCLTSAISADEGGNPCEARAVAIMRSRYHAADKGVAEQRQCDRRREQREIVEPPPPDRDRQDGNDQPASTPARPARAAG